MVEMQQARRALDDLGRTVVTVYTDPDPTSFTGRPSAAVKRYDELVPQLFTLAERLLVMVEEMEQFSEDVAGTPALLAAVSSQKLRGVIEEVLA
jgi:hypothetical protein